MDNSKKLESYQSSNIGVNFECQSCSQSLEIHPSGDKLEQSTSSVQLNPNSDVGSSSLKTFQNIYKSGNHKSRKLSLPIKLREMDNGFIFVGDTEDDTEAIKPSPFENNETRIKLYDQSDIDYPLCITCTDSLLEQMDQQLQMIKDNCKEYQKSLQKFVKDDDEEGDLENLQEKLNTLEVEKIQQQSELYEIEEKEKYMENILTDLSGKQEKLKKVDTQCWLKHAVLKRQMLLCEDEQKSMNNQLDYAQVQYKKMSETDIFKSTFHIWCDGDFGTINNFRLGRLPNITVSWPEINAAWGQTALLLHCLAKKCGFTFDRYQLVPDGNRSYLKSINNQMRQFPLYYSGGYQYVWNTKFDQAMVAFLDCLQQFQQKVGRIDSSARNQLPYTMESGKIGCKAGATYSIEYHLNSKEEWTKALKCMLTNLKFLLIWVSEGIYMP